MQTAVRPVHKGHGSGSIVMEDGKYPPHPAHRLKSQLG